ncbi:hypothetical protein CO608_08015 [Lysobacteraceae bacterium NML08-0793]|nr:hypothetical protein CO608_08015 [Xanthomonadaceae bacterium NML08-0793]
MLISGVDYILETDLENIDIVKNCIQKISSLVWHEVFYDVDEDDGILYLFIAKNEEEFDKMDEFGFFSNENDGPFLIISNKLNPYITLVLPEDIEHNCFCKKIYFLIKGAVGVGRVSPR